LPVPGGRDEGNVASVEGSAPSRQDPSPPCPPPALIWDVASSMAARVLAALAAPSRFGRGLMR